MRRAFLALVTGGALGLMLLVLAAFVWPDEAESESLNVGSEEAFEVGEPRWLEGLPASDFRWTVEPVMDSPGSTHAVTVVVLKHADGSFSAFSDRDPRNGCPLAWRTDLDHFGPGGFFRDPCHGSTYDERGTRVFGPTPRDLDYLDVEVDEAGEVIVDLRTLHRGRDARTYGDADSTPTPAADLGGS